MPVMVVHHTPSLTQERYEAVVRGLTGGRPRLTRMPSEVSSSIGVSVSQPPKRVNTLRR